MGYYSLTLSTCKQVNKMGEWVILQKKMFRFFLVWSEAYDQ